LCKASDVQAPVDLQDPRVPRYLTCPHNLQCHALALQVSKEVLYALPSNKIYLRGELKENFKEIIIKGRKYLSSTLEVNKKMGDAANNSEQPTREVDM